MDEHEQWRSFEYGWRQEQLSKVLVYEDTYGVPVNSKESIQFN
jgi:hypothetical protein